ncbi:MULTISPECIES: copper resistance system multicopper oxidase [Methylomonas]|uniref:Copper resistance protein CopA n=2 Tax=Methylomonas TaxID=416 RepID=A0A126T8N9_9GAMM|nr:MULTISPECIES: copper resistance system multicopper oxidase [Methylomonas]AMK78431.1 copper resistance protein CopA [Methylomonas denitrificans]OAI04134.1 copper resistance protein CopA [Methylomonas methanica]TCV87539.1 CopA family copper-resistance protein [Methylomonas methanica]
MQYWDFSPARCPAVWLLLASLVPGITQADVYRLSISEKSINLIGETQPAVLADEALPAPTLHWREGEEVTLHVTNLLNEPTSIHWHGIILPYQMDGVPGISFDGIEPGQTFTYQFKVKQSGTYWYHGHSGMQEQQGLFGALIIAPQQEQQTVDRDYVVMLSDWPRADPERTMARLKKQSDYYNFQKRTVGNFFADIRRLGFWETVSDRLAWGEMRMEPTDLADVTGANYRFLINGQTAEAKPLYLFKPGEKLRLRFINASAMTHFDVRLPGLKMTVIAADGQPVEPVDVEEFRIAVAETYDVLVQPQTEQAYSIFAEAMDRSGYANATLTPRAGLQAALPAMRPMTLLTLAEMGGEHAGHAAHQAPVLPPVGAENSHAHTEHSAAPDPTMTEHAGHQHATAETLAIEHAGHDTPRADTAKPLSYSQLIAEQPNHALMGPPDREITLRLTGNMQRYIWSFDDTKYADAEPIRVKFGERIRFTYVNETMMNHPIHIHGLWQYLDNGNGMYNPKKHVINVKPGQTVSVDVPADAEGEWAFHCHLLYHMDTGMFRKLIVERAEHVH